MHVADPFAPESALEPSITQLESANRLLGLAPVVLSIYTDVLTTLVNKNGLQTEFILPDGLLDSIDDNYAHRFTATDMPDHFDFYVTEHELPYALWIMEFDDRVTAGMTVHENGGVRGVLMNDSPEAVRWAREEYAQYREQARYVTLDLTV